MIRRFENPLIIIVFIALFLSVPAGAVNASIYGSTAGFNPEIHKGEFVVMYSLPASHGADLDRDVAKYTDPAVDVIFIGGDDGFSTSTAAKVEQTVSDGRILVISYNSSARFNTSLPAANDGTAPEDSQLLVTNPKSAVSKEVFAGLRRQFQNTTLPAPRKHGITRTGAETLLSYENDDPALVFWEYGRGYVIEWTLSSPLSFLTGLEADSVNERLIRYLLRSRVPVTSAPTPQTTVPIPAVNTTTIPLPNVSVTSLRSTGNLTIYSSPVNAAVLIDGEYAGTTPLTLSGIPSGYHVLKLTLSGHYDYDSRIYVIEGQDVKVFGTLHPIGLITPRDTPLPTTTTSTPVPVITVLVTPTSASGVMENPGVVAAIIGVIAATIGSVATIYSTMTPKKKE